jgi:transposase
MIFILISNIIYGLLLLFGISSLIIDYLTDIKNKTLTINVPLMSKTIDLSRVSTVLLSIFDLLTIPIAVIMTISCAFTAFSGLERINIRSLVLTGILIVIALVIALLREKLLNPLIYDKNAATESISEHAADLEYIEIYSEISKSYAGILSDIAKAEKLFAEQANEAEAVFARTNAHIESYTRLQNEQCVEIIKGKNDVNAIFKTLEISATSIKNSFTQFNHKLEASAAALEYCGESEKLLEDINISFKDLFYQNRVLDDELIRKVERLLSSIDTLAFKCANIQSLPKSYSDIIGVYSAKIETTFNSFIKNDAIKQADIAKLCETIAAFLGEKDAELLDINKSIAVYLLKNRFVLTKILETYKNNSLNKRDLKKLQVIWRFDKDKI